MLDQHHTDYTRLIPVAQVRNGIRDQVKLPMRVDQRESSVGDRDVRQIFRVPFRKILDNVREKFELINEVRELWGIDRGELSLQIRQLSMHSLQNLR